MAYSREEQQSHTPEKQQVKKDIISNGPVPEIEDTGYGQEVIKNMMSGEYLRMNMAMKNFCKSNLDEMKPDLAAQDSQHIEMLVNRI